MLNGYAPKGIDGNSINLHHAIQSEKGALIEVTETMHKEWSKILHVNPNSIQSGINRSAFDAFRQSYWNSRAINLVQRFNLTHIKLK